MLGNLLIAIIRKNDIFSRDEIMAIIDEKDLIDKQFLLQARQIVVQQFEQLGIQIPQVPDPPDPAILQSAPPELQEEMVVDFQEAQAIDNEILAAIDELARPLAIDLMMDEIGKWKQGRYDTVLTMSPFAATYRISQAVETFELNKALIESGYLPVDRRSLIESTDVANKEEIIERGEQQQAALQSQQ